MKVHELIEKLLKAPAGSEVVLFNNRTETEYHIEEASFDDGTIDSFTDQYPFNIFIGRKINT